MIKSYDSVRRVRCERSLHNEIPYQPILETYHAHLNLEHVDNCDLNLHLNSSNRWSENTRRFITRALGPWQTKWHCEVIRFVISPTWHNV